MKLWAARYHPLRALLFVKGIYLLLACDLWLEMVEHGGRYGVGGFNVAHFELFDRLIPLPTPGLYVGLLIASGLVALQLALGPAPRWLRTALAAGYTLSWMISIHDSYQHHYLLSWLLLWCVAIPDLRAHEVCAQLNVPRPSARPSAAAAEQKGASGHASRELVQGWGFPMTAITSSIVYFFTGISKIEPEWRRGDVLRVLTRTAPPESSRPGKFDGARDLLLQMGLDEGTAWQLLALSAIGLQWTIALAYLAAPHRDERLSRARTAITWAGLLAAISFHLTAELFHVFEIGLFSYYMLWTAAVVLGPVQLLVPIARALTWAGQQLAGLFAESRDAPLARAEALDARWAWVLAAALLALVGLLVPLPGARAAASCVALLTALRMVAAFRAGALVELRRLAVHSALSALALWLALTRTNVPFDYYRRTAGELRNMGQLERALEMYRAAERYAPRGRSRAGAIRELEAELARRGARSDER